MATIYRMRVAWAGSPVVGPGLSTFYLNSVPVPADIAALNAFFTACLAGKTPTGVTWSIPDGGDEIESTTGALVGGWGTGTTTGVTSTAGGSYAEGVGLRVRWGTAGIAGGRHVTGTTYAVPCQSGVFDGTGHVLPAIASDVVTRGNTLVTALAGKMVVWSRPTLTRTGSAPAVTGVSCPLDVTWLRSRRT